MKSVTKSTIFFLCCMIVVLIAWVVLIASSIKSKKNAEIVLESMQQVGESQLEVYESMQTFEDNMGIVRDNMESVLESMKTIRDNMKVLSGIRNLPVGYSYFPLPSGEFRSDLEAVVIANWTNKDLDVVHYADDSRGIGIVLEGNVYVMHKSDICAVDDPQDIVLEKTISVAESVNAHLLFHREIRTLYHSNGEEETKHCLGTFVLSGDWERFNTAYSAFPE